MAEQPDLKVEIKAEDIKQEYDEAHQAAQFTCRECGKVFAKKSHLGMHMFMHSCVKKYECGICGQRFTCKHALLKHRESHSVTPEVVEHRDTRTSLEHQVMHAVIEHRDARAVIEYRDICTDIDKLRTHELSHHPDCVSSTKQEEIDSASSTDHRTKADSHHNCKKCLSYRVKTAGKVKCDVCGKLYNDKGTLVKHKKIHTKGGKFECGTCGKQFTQKGNLARHIQIHTEERKFECLICGSLFRQKTHLVYHLQTHDSKKD